MKISICNPLFLFLLLMFFLPSTASNADENGLNLFAKGNEACSRGDFSAAIQSYEQLVATSGYASGVLFNLGNCYALSGQTGMAILNYERALRLSPSDSDTHGNLELIRKENGLFPREYSWSERFFMLLDMNQWAMSAFSALLVFSAFQLSLLKLSVTTQIQRLITAICCLLLILSVVGAFYRHQQWHSSVVTGNNSRLLLSPFSSATSISSIQQGRLVYPKKNHGEFSYVTDETGRKGWIVSSAITPVVEQDRQ